MLEKHQAESGSLVDMVSRLRSKYENKSDACDGKRVEEDREMKRRMEKREDEQEVRMKRWQEIN